MDTVGQFLEWIDSCFYVALSVSVMFILVVVPAATGGNELQKTLTGWYRSELIPDPLLLAWGVIHLMFFCNS